MIGQELKIGEQHGRHIDKAHVPGRQAHINPIGSNYGFQQGIFKMLIQYFLGVFQGILEIKGVFFAGDLGVAEEKGTQHLGEQVVNQLNVILDGLAFSREMLLQFGRHFTPVGLQGEI